MIIINFCWQQYSRDAVVIFMHNPEQKFTVTAGENVTSMLMLNG